MSTLTDLENALNVPLMALATSVDDKPNVRVMDFVYEPERMVILIPTNRKSRKVMEFNSNDIVAIATLPDGPGPVVRITDAVVTPAGMGIAAIREKLIAKRPAIEKMLDGFGEDGDVYAISFRKATIIDKGQASEVEIPL